MTNWDNMQWFMAGFGTMLIIAVIAIKIVFRNRKS